MLKYSEEWYQDTGNHDILLNIIRDWRHVSKELLGNAFYDFVFFFKEDDLLEMISLLDCEDWSVIELAIHFLGRIGRWDCVHDCVYKILWGDTPKDHCLKMEAIDQIANAASCFNTEFFTLIEMLENNAKFCLEPCERYYVLLHIKEIILLKSTELPEDEVDELLLNPSSEKSQTIFFAIYDEIKTYIHSG